MTERGVFVVLEGGDATGKSTQVAALVERLRGAGRRVVETFEPGATPLGARIRAAVLEGVDALDPVTEALLMAADRAQHVTEVIRPALEQGCDVVSDRHVPSSLAYQGIARGLGLEVVAAASRWATRGLEPDVVVVLDVPDAVARARRPAEVPDRMEREPAPFHDAVRAAYRDLAGRSGWVLVDGDAPPATVAERVWAVVRDRFGL